jgi:hypothetical protein
MPAERIAMRQVRDVLWLKAAGVSGNEIARRVGVAPSTVRLTLKRLARRRARLAVAGRDDRCRAGGAALYRGRHQAGTPRGAESVAADPDLHPEILSPALNHAPGVDAISSRSR